MSRKMKDSGIEWIGEIPKDWGSIKTKKVFDVISGATPKSGIEKYWNGDIAWVTPSDYKTDDIYITQTSRRISKYGLKSCGTELVPVNSIIISNRAPIGSVALNQIPLCTNQGCKSLAVKNDNLSTKYYYYYFSIMESPLNMLGRGSTFLELSTTDLKTFNIPYPNPIEQQKIAIFLDKKVAEIDHILEKTRESIEEYKKYKQSIITEAVTKGLNSDVKMKDSGIEWIGEIPEHWGTTKTKNVTQRITDGAHISPETDNGVYDFISTVNIDNGRIDFENCLRTSIESYELMVRTGCKPSIGDVLISKDGTVGKTAIVNQERDFVVSSSLVIMKPSSLIDSYFLDFILNSNFVKEQLNSFMKGAGLRRVSVANNGNLFVTIPPKVEQINIASYLSNRLNIINQLISQKELLLSDLETYKKSLIYECVTGKREVD